MYTHVKKKGRIRRVKLTKEEKCGKCKDGENFNGHI